MTGRFSNNGLRITLITQINNFRTRTKGRWPKGKAIAISELLFNRNGQKIIQKFFINNIFQDYNS